MIAGLTVAFLLLVPTMWALVSPVEKAGNLIQFGDREHLRQRHQLARQYYLDAAAVAPNYWRVHERLGMNSLASEEPDTAIEHFQRAYSLEPQSPAVLHQYASAAIKTGRHPIALKLLREALVQSPQSMEAMVLMYELELQRGRLDRARLWMRKLLEINPYHWAGHRGLADLAMRQELWEEAAREYQLAIGGTHGSNAVMAYNRAVPLFRLGRSAEALQTLQEALRWNPKMAQAHLVLGMTLKDFEPARASYHLQTYLKLQPEGPSSDEARQALKGLPR